MKLELEEIIKATSAKVLKNDIKTGKLNFSTDTRTIQKGDIFVPIKGETFDGENFIENALNNGAKAYFTRNEKVFDKMEFMSNRLDRLKPMVKDNVKETDIKNQININNLRASFKI